jgi:hypothetical protein
MLGMQRGNAGFAPGSLGAGAAPAVELALLSPAGLKSRPTTLQPRSTAPCSATQALDFPGSSDQVLIHRDSMNFILWNCLVTGSPLQVGCRR